jgi:hypothetical protein
MRGVGKVTLTNADLRENFKVAAMMIAHANGVDVSKIDLNQLVQGYVLSMINATPNFSQLQFPITNTDIGSINNAPLNPLMRVVNQVDSFVAGKLGYYLMFYAFSGGNQSNPDYTSSVRMFPITYPSPYATSTNGNATMDTGTIMFWHAYISIEVNGIKLYKNWECYQHLMIPQAQATPVVGGTPPNGAWVDGVGNQAFVSPFSTSNVLPYWQPNFWNPFDGGNDAFYPLEPLPVFSGSKQSIVLLNLPGNIPPTIAPFSLGTSGYGTSWILKICLHLRGVLAQNSTSLH